MPEGKRLKMSPMSAKVPAAEAPSTSSSPMGKIIVVILFMAAVAAFFYFDLKQYVSLDALKANRDRLLAFTESYYVVAVVTYILL